MMIQIKTKTLQRNSSAILVAAIVSVPLFSGVAVSAEVVNLYSYRQPFLIKPFIDEFSKRSGVTVNVVFAKKGMLERLKREGTNSPADAILTTDISRLKAHADADLLKSIQSDELNQNIPIQFRDPKGHWFGLTFRARLLAVSKERVAEGAIKTYEDLADPKWKGKICVRKGGHVYNRALVASLIAHHGVEKAEQLVGKIVGNFARKPQGNDRAQAKAVFEGVCDIAIINNYYFGKMKFNEKKLEQKIWAEALRLVFPNQEDRGTHVNVSGAAVTKHSKNVGNAVKLIEFLSTPFAQNMYASTNYEYPVNSNVDWSNEVVSWGRFKADMLDLAKIADLSPAAQKLADRVGWQ
jgi:iron(III) transport system substrate-binding protein